MKTFKITLITLIVFAFISCNETNFGNKVMKDFGSGKYVRASSGVYSSDVLDLLNATKGMDILLNKETFSMAEIHDKEAKQESKIENFEDYFHIDVMFDDYDLVESQHSKEDLLRLVTIPESGDEIVIEALRLGQEWNRKKDENYLPLSEYSYISTAYTDIDKFRLKYKITVNQTYRIAYLTVFKIPGEGYRVTSFIIL